jgi:hypothetical protein
MVCMGVYSYTLKVYGHFFEFRNFFRIRLLQLFVYSRGKGFLSNIIVIPSSRREGTGYLKRTLWDGVANTRVQAGERNVSTDF